MFPKIVLIIAIVALLSACTAPPAANPAPTETLPATLPPTASQTSIPTSTSTPEPPATPETYTSDELSQMTDGQRQEVFNKAPEIDGLTKSNYSETKNNLIVYRDETDTAQMVFNLTTGRELTLQQAGIIELPQTDGGAFELLSFQTAEEIAKFVISKDVVWGNGGANERRIYMEKIFFKNFDPTPQEQALFNELNKITGLSVFDFKGITLPQANNASEKIDFFGMVLFPAGINITLVEFKDNSGIQTIVHCNINITDLYNALGALEDFSFTASN